MLFLVRVYRGMKICKTFKADLCQPQDHSYMHMYRTEEAEEEKKLNDTRGELKVH